MNSDKKRCIVEYTMSFEEVYEADSIEEAATMMAENLKAHGSIEAHAMMSENRISYHTETHWRLTSPKCLQ